MNKTCLVSIALALAACGGSSSAPPGQSSSCSVTLSGAVSGTFDCKPATAGWESADNLGVFTFHVAPAGSTPDITVAVGFTGEPHTGTYAGTDAGAATSIAVTSGSGASASYWLAAVSTGSPQGSYSLHFSSVSNSVTVPGGKSYSTEGTLTATLPAVPGTSATGTVTLSATF